MKADARKRHEENRLSWNSISEAYHRTRTTRWRETVSDPSLGFSHGSLALLKTVCPDLDGLDACVLGSGDQFAAFGLAGMGARVTSVDISEEQLAVATERASELGLEMAFIQADVCDVGMLSDASFDLVCCTNGMLIWVSDLPQFYREAARILRPDGIYFWFDIHPFQRPFNDDFKLKASYFDNEPMEFWSDSEDVNRPAEGVPVSDRSDLARNFVTHYTVADLVNPMADAGLSLLRMRETPVTESWWTFDRPDVPVDELLSWKTNPVAGLPAWMAMGARKLA